MNFRSIPQLHKFKSQEGLTTGIVIAIIIVAVAVLGAVGYFGYKQARSPKIDVSQPPIKSPDTVALDDINDHAISEEADLSVVDDYLNEIARKPFPAKEISADQVIAQIKIISKKSEVGAWPAKYEIKVERIGTYYRYPDARYPELKSGERVVVYITAFYDYNSPSPSLDNIVVGTSYPAYLTICHQRQVVCPEGEKLQSWMVNLFPTEKIVRVTDLKIISPAQGSTVRIGDTVVFKVAVDDSLQRDVFYTTPWGASGYVKAPDYEIHFTVPSTFVFGGRTIALSPGQKRFGVVGGDKASSDEVFINLVK